MTTQFAIEGIEPIMLHGVRLLENRALMSPYVWQAEDGAFHILVRAVPPKSYARLSASRETPARETNAPPSGLDTNRPDVGQEESGRWITGRIWHGQGSDGLTFMMDPTPLIEPGPDDLDINGCEDPTVVCADGQIIIYYTGLDINHDGQMLYATGEDIHSIEKHGIALASSKTERHTKEATVTLDNNGHWRLFYEYARNGASLVGLGVSDGPAGPWHEQPQPFAPRPDCWDSWHLSTGPLLMTDADRPVMFYNGATRSADWGIGWISFDHDFSQVIERCTLPLIGPPDAGQHGIAFAASLIARDDRIHLYYSTDDRTLFRATLQRH